MSSYNGEMYLDEQLESIVAQKGVMTDILVRDDGSSDHTCDILDQWQQKTSLRWYSGENIGPARSFMDLLRQSGDSCYYAFSDQDDYWLSDKLKVAVDKLESYDEMFNGAVSGEVKEIIENKKIAVCFRILQSLNRRV